MFRYHVRPYDKIGRKISKFGGTMSDHGLLLPALLQDCTLICCSYSICLIFSTFLCTLVRLYSICHIFSTFLRTLVRLYSICLIFSTFLCTLVRLYRICLVFSAFLHTLVGLYSICLVFSTFLCTFVCTVFVLSSQLFSVR